MGADPVSGLTGPGGRVIGTQADLAHASRWLALPGLDEDAVVAEVTRIMAAKADGPPSSFRYFDRAMERLSAALSAPPLEPAAGPIGFRPAAQPDWDSLMARIGLGGDG